MAKKNQTAQERRHIELIKEMPCYVTGKHPERDSMDRPQLIDPHHLLRVPVNLGGKHGTSEKNDDCWAIPLFHDIHTALHRGGNEEAFLELHNRIHQVHLAQALWKVTGDKFAMIKVLVQHRFVEIRGGELPAI